MKQQYRIKSTLLAVCAAALLASCSVGKEHLLNFLGVICGETNEDEYAYVADYHRHTFTANKHTDFTWFIL